MRSILITAAAVGGLLTALAATHAASAVPLAKVQTAPQGIASPVGGHGGHGGHGGGGGHGGHGGGGGHGGHGGGGHGGHGRGYSFYGAPFVGYGAYYYGGYGGYSEGCGWLRRRAQATGSRYWWARYEDCVDDNY